MTTSSGNESPVQRFPMRRRCPFAPAEEYARLREHGPLSRVELPNGQPGWVVTRHAEIRQVLAHPGISTDITRPGFPQMIVGAPELDLAANPYHEGEFFNMDSPRHDELRRMQIPEFSVKRVKAMRPGIQAMIDGLVDGMLAGGPPADLAEDFALPIPSVGICLLLGVPTEDSGFFQTRIRSRKMVDAGEMEAAVDEIRAYTDDLVTRAERDPGDDMIGRLVVSRRRTGELSHNALVGMTVQLLIAAHETTANMVMLGVLTLLRHQDQLARLRADPALWPAAVEELLRFHSIADGPTFARLALTDIPVGDRVIPAGDPVFPLCASGNHDERAYARPDRFDLDRGGRNHLAFGYGVHQCLGQNLARAWLETAYETLFRRIPSIRPAVDVDSLPFKYDAAIFGLDELPVTW